GAAGGGGAGQHPASGIDARLIASAVRATRDDATGSDGGRAPGLLDRRAAPGVLSATSSCFARSASWPRSFDGEPMCLRALDRTCARANLHGRLAVVSQRMTTGAIARAARGGHAYGFRGRDRPMSLLR